MHLGVLNHLLVIVTKIKQLRSDECSSNNKDDHAPRGKEELISWVLF